MVPDAILQPLVDNNVIQLIVIALSLGCAACSKKAQQIAEGRRTACNSATITTLFEAVIRILKWVIWYH